MRIRGRERYLSEEVDRWLRMISEAHGLFTPDEVADNLLRAIIAKKCPAFESFQKKVNELAETFYDDIREKFPVIIIPGKQPRLDV